MVEKALFDIASGPQCVEAYRQDPDAFLRAYVLEADELEMIKQLDVRRMIEREANPMLAMRAFTMLEGRAQMPEYIRRLKGGR